MSAASLVERLWWSGLGTLVATMIALAIGRIPSIHPAAKVWMCRLVYIKALFGILWAFTYRYPTAPTGRGPAAPLADIYLLIVWLIGVGIVASSLARAYRAARLLRVLATPQMADIGDDARAFGIGALDILSARNLNEPCVVGAFRPCLIVPESGPIPRGVLLHELAHVAHKDYAWNALSWLSYALFWFVPGMGRLVKEMSLWQEAWADLVARRMASIEPREQAQTILSVLDRSRFGTTAALGHSGDAAVVQRRIKAMYQPSYSLALTLALAVFIVSLSIPMRLEGTPVRGTRTMRAARVGGQDPLPTLVKLSP